MKGAKRTVSASYVRRHRTPKVAELLAHDIANYIIEKNLEVAVRLPHERQMLEETGRARSTLREALRLLETRGVVEMRQGVDGGPIVRRPNAADLGEAMSLILAFDGASMLDVIEAREELEVLAVSRAVSRISEKQIKQLAQSVEKQITNIDDRDIFLHESRHFHGIIYSASGSRVITILNEALQLTTHINIAAIEYSLEHRQHVIKAHQAILLAFRDRDAKKAANAMRVHVCDSGHYWQKVAGPLAKRRVTWPIRG